MRKNGVFFIILATLILVLVFVRYGRDASDAIRDKDERESFGEIPEELGVSAVLESIAGDIAIDPWLSPEGEQIFFLPSFAKNVPVRLSYDEKSCSVTLDGEKAPSGYELSPHACPGRIGISTTDGGNVLEYDLKCMYSENIPAVFLQTGKGDMSGINSDKTVSDEGSWLGIDADGSIDHSGGFNLIRARGNSSFQADKKSYRIKLAKKADIFGMGADKSWILQANAYDNTRIRNTLALEMARRWGIKYTPLLTPADLYIDGEYYGSYIVQQPIKAGPGHVDIKGDDSYIFETVHEERRLEEDRYSFLCGGEFFLQVLYPDKPSGSEKEYVKNHLNRLDQLITNLGHEDPLDELGRYLDLTSFADMYLFNFVTNDIDAGNYSTYCYIDGADGLLHMGPVWDYDKAFGNEKKKNSPVEFNSYSWRWPEILSDNSEFSRIIDERLAEVSPVIEDMLDGGIDSLAREVSASVDMDLARYGNQSSQSVNEGSLDKNLEQLRSYMRGRYELLKDTRQGGYVRVYIGSRTGRLFWLKRGGSLGSENIEFIKKLYECRGVYRESGMQVSALTVFDEDEVIYPGKAP